MRIKNLVPTLVLTLAAGFVFAQFPAVQPILPGALRWATPPGLPDVKGTWIIGAEADAAPYVQRVILRADGRIPPHTHPDTRYSTVLSGVLYVGFGDVARDAALVAVPPGAVYVAPANVPHFLWARDGEVVYQETGNGPTATNILAVAGGRRLDIDLKADCSRCTGLCCVAPAFDSNQGFGFDKPAHEPCRHLRPDDGCAIHSQLAARGFPGCVQFDCHGAGQRITQQFFPGQHWRDSAGTARALFDAYSRLLPLHELMAMIAWALPKVADAPAREQLEQLSARIAAAGPPIVAGTGEVATHALREETLALLREKVPRPAPGQLRS